ncbi:nucleotidyltransferase family protein [Streptomyces sp. F-1]|uniref:nucleotidyltransferase family protein n=1 Tax=Streptomyces sp. F-1 TaxID=463642 RepID=UPI00086EA221|nr:nucleotidyltransferase family protein [Streptomyces sp. F-1]SFY48635.1 hypothetical protein STEPF1_01861 [Streptomyces sp. F-1]
MTHNGEETAAARRPQIQEVTELRLPPDGPRPQAPQGDRSTPPGEEAPGRPHGSGTSTGAADLPQDGGTPPGADAPDLPHDRSQAILEAAKQIGALLKRAGHPFALAGSVAVYAHGGSRYLQHDADFCVLPGDADAVAATLREAGLAVRTPPEDWLLKTTCQGQNVDIIFALAHEPVTKDMLERAHVLPVDSVLMPVLCPTDLIRSLISAFSEHYCDFGSVLPVARAVREKVDWDVIRDTCGDQPMPAAFLFLLERLDVIAPREQRT